MSTDGSDKGVVRVYGALVALYPRKFRDDYGADMVQLVRGICDDEPTWRVSSRIVADLAISIPTQHLERHMHRTPTQLIPLIYTAIAGAGLVLALVGGTNPAMFAVGLIVTLIAGAAAVISWRRVAPEGPSIQTTYWWKLILAGVGLIGGVIAAGTAGVEAWEAGMLAGFLGVILIGTGLLLGLLRLATRRPPVIPT